MHFYNDIEPFANDWTRNLMRAGHIPEGDISATPIQELRASDLVGYTRRNYFAGISGWPFALRLAGWPDDRPIWSGYGNG